MTWLCYRFTHFIKTDIMVHKSSKLALTPLRSSRKVHHTLSIAWLKPGCGCIPAIAKNAPASLIVAMAPRICTPFSSTSPVSSFGAKSFAWIIRKLLDWRLLFCRRPPPSRLTRRQNGWNYPPSGASRCGRLWLGARQPLPWLVIEMRVYLLSKGLACTKLTDFLIKRNVCCNYDLLKADAFRDFLFRNQVWRNETNHWNFFILFLLFKYEWCKSKPGLEIWSFGFAVKLTIWNKHQFL